MKGKIKQKHIEMFLQDINDFDQNEKEKWHLEQHMTPPAIAANLISTIIQIEGDIDIENQIVCDLGCGTGMLMAGMLYCGAFKAIGFDIDQKYIQNTKFMLEEKFDNDISLFDLINIDIKLWKNPSKTKLYDTVIMNPPFGTKEEGIDIHFLKQAFNLVDGSVYSLHKTCTRDFLAKFAQENNYEFELLNEIKFPLPKRFKNYHKKDVGYTDVDFIRFYQK